MDKQFNFNLHAHEPSYYYGGGRGGSGPMINEKVRKAVFFLGVRREDGGFVPYGTGFLMFEPLAAGDPKGFVFAVTARHVLEDARESGLPIVGRFNGKDGGDPSMGLMAYDHWHFHPAIPGLDIAVSWVSVSTDTFDVAQVGTDGGLLTADYIRANDIGNGDEVMTIGLLARHFGRSRNIPIVRAGNIAAMPEEPVDLGEFGHHLVYLIESRSIGGLSGSPVFLKTPPHRIVKGNIFAGVGHNTEYLLGVNIGLFETLAHADRVPTEKMDRREHFLELMSSGIAVVIPIERVMETWQQEALLKKREESRETHNKGVGFKPSSARPIVPLSDAPAELPKADNPAHKGDFTALLGEAAQSRSKGG